MSCTTKTYNKIMAKVRNKYPTYGLKRRKNIVGAIIYRRKQ